MKLLRAPAYAWRRTYEAALYARGKVILRRYTRHYLQSRGVYLSERGSAVPPMGEVGVRVVEAASLPIGMPAIAGRVAAAVDRAFEDPAQCRFFPPLESSRLPPRTRDVPELRQREILSIRLKAPFAIEGLEELAEPLVRHVEDTIYGSYAIVDKVYIYRNPVSATRPRASWRWHFDNHPREMLKVMVYLTDVDDDSAPFEYLSARATGQAILGAPLTPLFGDSRVPPAEIERREQEDCVTTRVTGPAGTVVVFDDNIIHRATLAKSRLRDVVVFQLRPCDFRPARPIDRWTGTFGDLDVSASPDTYERRPQPHRVTAAERGRAALRAIGIGRGLVMARRAARTVIDGEHRALELKLMREYLDWRQHRDVLQAPLFQPDSSQRALIVTKGTLRGAQMEMALLKGLELGGFEPVVLSNRTDLKKHYRLCGVREFVRWDRFRAPVPNAEARKIVDAARRLEDLVDFEHQGARVGKFAISTTFRTLRTGRLDFERPDTRQELARHIASGMARAVVSHQLLDATKPKLALFMGNRYTGQGELMDICIHRGVDVLTWFDAHRSSALMLKRYQMENRDRHHGSISDASWHYLSTMPWTELEKAALRRELHDSYAAGDWYSRGGTQVNKSLIATEELRRRLSLDPGKKTAVIFPHILWDATLFWGRDLFANYEDWLIETVRAACANTRVNWVIKIHPAHVAKNAMERVDDEPAELVAIRERIGPLPPHITVIPPDTDINTYSLFGLMDYCLTVRGTIGIESACLGKRVITAGTGRYDHRGFTTDPETAADYLALLGSIETLPPPTPAEQELAERFAYGAFVWRPLPMSTFTIEHGRDVEATMRVTLKARSVDELRNGADLQALGRWAASPGVEDFTWDGARA